MVIQEGNKEVCHAVRLSDPAKRRYLYGVLPLGSQDGFFCDDAIAFLCAEGTPYAT